MWLSQLGFHQISTVKKVRRQLARNRRTNRTTSSSLMDQVHQRNSQFPSQCTSEPVTHSDKNTDTTPKRKLDNVVHAVLFTKEC